MQFVIFCIAAVSLCSAASFNIGETKLLTEGRISRSRNATEGQFPYMVCLFLNSDAENQLGYKCGGSLIGNEWILTAAHCTEDIKQVLVLLGATDIRYPEVGYMMSSKDIIAHSDYNPVSLENDIALIKIPFTYYTTKIMPVRLPSFASLDTTYSGVLTVMTGWGGTNDDNSAQIKHLRWAKLYTIENSFCAVFYKNVKITTSNICIDTSLGIGIYKGDSGGPLISLATNTQIGISSFNAALGYPAVFTRITSYLEWIRQHTGISYS